MGYDNGVKGLTALVVGAAGRGGWWESGALGVGNNHVERSFYKFRHCFGWRVKVVHAKYIMADRKVLAYRQC